MDQFKSDVITHIDTKLQALEDKLAINTEKWTNNSNNESSLNCVNFGNSSLNEESGILFDSSL
jgi:hypothetical protein